MISGHKRVKYGNEDRQFIDVFPCSSKADAKCPLIIFLHGGAWYSGATSDHYDLAEYISSHSSMAVALIDYRLTQEGNGVYHPDHINDVYAALIALFKEDTAAPFGYDTSKICFMGHSAGGYMVLAAALASDLDQSKFSGPIRNMPKLESTIRNRIKAFVAVESIFSIAGLLDAFPSYISFVKPAFYPPGQDPSENHSELKKAGPEAWPSDQITSQSKIYIIHSSEDTLLSSEYNSQGVRLLQNKGLKPIVDLKSFKVSSVVLEG
jgi:predicted esterase